MSEFVSQIRKELQEMTTEELIFMVAFALLVKARRLGKVEEVIAALEQIVKADS